MTGNTPRLELDGITRIFDDAPVVDGLSLALEAGQVTCLLGPSGCGKSTTLRIAAGVDKQNAGRVLIDGSEVSGSRRHLPPEKRSIGLMFQDFALFPHLSVADNVAFGLKKASRSEKQARVAELLERAHLADFGPKYPHQLSGGEQQRVALVRALAPKPHVMLMDEPFSGLDNRLRDDIRDDTLSLLKEEGTAVLLVTHEPDEAMRMADKIALMRDGRIVQMGAPYNLYNAPVDREAAAFFSNINVIHGVTRNALTDTPFGQFLTPGMENDADVEIIIRPQHLKIDFDRDGKGPDPTPSDGVAARAIVRRARFMGAESLIEFKMDHDGSDLRATVPGVFLPKPDTALWLTIRRDRCFVFPCVNQRKVSNPIIAGRA